MNASLLICVSMSIAAAGCGKAIPDGSVKLEVDASGSTKPISPYIYGVNQAQWSGDHKYLHFGRIGGNRITAYNWETNASNAGSDWHHQNDDFMGGGDVAGEAMRKPIADAVQAGKSILVTVPMAGYVSADKKGDGDVNKTPDYLTTRFVPTKPRKTKAYQYPPDLNDGVVYEDEFVWWVEKTFAGKPKGTEIFYALDNEPDIWSGTHARIVPKTPTYAAFIKRSTEYASAIKRVAPKTKIFGPVNYGWQGMVRFQNASDANNRDFLDVYLDAMQEAEKENGARLLDVLDIHWYTEAQGAGKRITEETSDPESVGVRVQSARGLYDSTYREPSWIQKTLGDEPIRLLPRMMEKIQKHYPDTKLAITEYNYGASKSISGALAEVEALGAFGAYGVFAANVWGGTDPGSFINAGLDLFCNYDGKGGHFGDQSIATKNPAIEKLAFFAAKDSKSGAITVVVVNRETTPTALSLGVVGRTADVYRVAGSEAKVKSVGAESVQGGRINTTLPPLSATLFVVR